MVFIATSWPSPHITKVTKQNHMPVPLWKYFFSGWKEWGNRWSGNKEQRI